MGEERLASLILAGQNPGRQGWYEEISEKWPNMVIYADSFILGRNKALLPVFEDTDEYKGRTIGSLIATAKRKKKEGDGSIDLCNLELMLQEQRACPLIHPDFIFPIGPEDDIRDQTTATKIIPQGRNLAQNLAKGIHHLFEEAKYPGEYFMVITGDVTMPTVQHYLDALQHWSRQREQGIEMYLGVARKDNIMDFLRENELEKYGIPKVELPVPIPFINNLNKFGIKVVDDRGMVDPIPQTYRFMYGNVFVFHKSVLHISDMENQITFLNGVKRGFFDVRNWYSLFKVFTPYDMWNVVAGKGLSLTSLEEKFYRWRGIRFKTFPVDHTFALDIDFWKDRKRAAAYLMRHSEEYQALRSDQ